MGLCISPSRTSIQKKVLLQRQNEHNDNLVLNEKKAYENGTGMNQTYKSGDIIGDNIDITRSPSQMSIDRRRKSWH